MVEEIQQQPQQQQDLSQIDSELRQQQQDLRKVQEDLREKRKYAKTVTISVGGQEKTISPDAALRDIEIQKRRITATRSDIKQHLKAQETQEAIRETPYYKAVSGTAEPTYSGVETETRTPEEAEAYQLQQEIFELKAQQPPQSKISKALSGIARKGFDITEQLGVSIKESFKKPRTFDIVGAGKRTFKPGKAETVIGSAIAGVSTAIPSLIPSVIATIPVVESISRKPIQLFTTVPKGLTIAGGLISKSIKQKPLETIPELIGGVYAFSKIKIPTTKVFKAEQFKIPTTEQTLLSSKQGVNIFKKLELTPSKYKKSIIRSRTYITPARIGDIEGLFTKRVPLFEAAPTKFASIKLIKFVTSPKTLISKTFISKKIPKVLQLESKPKITKSLIKLKSPQTLQISKASQFLGTQKASVLIKSKDFMKTQSIQTSGLIGRKIVSSRIALHLLKPIIKPKPIIKSKLTPSKLRAAAKTYQDILKQQSKIKISKTKYKPTILTKDIKTQFTFKPQKQTTTPSIITPKRFKLDSDKFKLFAEDIGTKTPLRFRAFEKEFKKPSKSKRYYEEETVLSPLLSKPQDFSKVFTTISYTIKTIPEFKHTAYSKVKLTSLQLQKQTQLQAQLQKQTQIQKQTQLQAQLQKQTQIQKPIIKQKSKIKLIQKPKVIIKHTQKQMIKPITKIKAISIPKVIIKPKYLKSQISRTIQYKPFKPIKIKFTKLTKPFQPTKTKDKQKKKPKGFKLLFGKRKTPQILTKVHAIEKGLILFKKQPKVKEFKLKKVLGTPKRLTHIKKQVKLRREGLTFKRRI